MKDKSIKLYNVDPDCARFLYYFQLGVLKKKKKMGEYACLYHPHKKAYWSKEKWLWQELHVEATHSLQAGASCIVINKGLINITVWLRILSCL